MKAPSPEHIRSVAGTLVGVDRQELEFDGDFLDLAARFAALEGAVLLLSGGDLEWQIKITSKRRVFT